MIDINKKYRYRNGEEARILCVDRPIKMDMCLVLSMDPNGSVWYHDENGRLCSDKIDSLLDLIEVKEKHVLWLNIYCQHKDDTWISKEEADKYSADERFARIKVTYEEGRFDE